MANHLLFLRHGQTDWNLQGRLTSRTDVPLNETGKTQARVIARNLVDTGVDKIITSPATRAQETASQVAATLSVNGSNKIIPAVDARLREIDFGEFEGLTRSDMESSGILSLFQGWITGHSLQSLKGVEPLAAAKARAYAVFQELSSDLSDTILVVTHGTTIRHRRYRYERSD
jgi:broad specificity phosphatase PhoE